MSPELAIAINQKLLYYHNTKITQNLIQICLLCAAIQPVLVQAQFNVTTNNGAITITGYTGSGGVVAIPSTINGLPVTGIETYAFAAAPALTLR